QIADQQVLYDKMSVQLVELDKHVRDPKNTVLEKDFKISELKECVCNKNLEIEKCLDCLNVCENKIHKMGQTSQTVHMIMPSKDNLYNGRKDEVVNLLEKEIANLETIVSLKSKDFESSESAVSKSENQNENDCYKIEKVCDKEENPKVIAPGMFKLNVSQCVSPILMSKSSCDLKNVEIKLKRKIRETSSASLYKDAMNVSCDSRMNDLLDDNKFFIFDDVNVRISPVSKMPFRKKPRDSMHIVQICLWIIDSGCSKHMTRNRALLTNFVEKFLETVCFGNNDFAVIAVYGDVVIGSMTIKKVYYVEGLGHNLFSVRQFCDKGLDM
nr:integrase, catalytic region, zinc finger, CCHC-type, peptidase aspartic, catalytic [Tanacetum cinerariifolium]